MTQPDGYFSECQGDGSPTCDCSRCSHSRLLRDYDASVGELLRMLRDNWCDREELCEQGDDVRKLRERLGLA